MLPPNPNHNESECCVTFLDVNGRPSCLCPVEENGMVLLPKKLNEVFKKHSVLLFWLNEDGNVDSRLPLLIPEHEPLDGWLFPCAERDGEWVVSRD